MEKPTGGKTPGTRRGTIPWSPTEVNILRHPGTIMEGYHSMLNNPGDHSAASYFKDTLDTSRLLSMEWYPSIIVPRCRRMFTSVGDHGMVPLLVPGVFPPVGFSMQARVFFRDTWHHPYITSCFLWKTFLLHLFLCFFWSASCTVAHAALH